MSAKNQVLMTPILIFALGYLLGFYSNSSSIAKETVRDIKRSCDYVYKDEHFEDSLGIVFEFYRCGEDGYFIEARKSFFRYQANSGVLGRTIYLFDMPVSLCRNGDKFLPCYG